MDTGPRSQSSAEEALGAEARKAEKAAEEAKKAAEEAKQAAAESRKASEEARQAGKERPEREKLWQEERKLLEPILKDRINFFLVFAGLVVNGILKLENPLRQVALYASSFLIVLLFIAIWRTTLLVTRILKNIRGQKDVGSKAVMGKSVYGELCEHDGEWWRPSRIIQPYKWNANWVLFAVSATIVMLFIALTVLSQRCPERIWPRAGAGTLSGRGSSGDEDQLRVILDRH